MLSTRERILKFSAYLTLFLSFSLPLKAEEWSIGIFTGDSPFNLSEEGIQNPVLTKESVTDIPADFVADPFIFLDNGVYHMFFEVLNATNNQGDLSYATSDDGISWEYQSVILDEPFHLSYPYVFRANGRIYMIPETHEAGSIRLYEATNFPTEWTFVSELMTGDQLVDNSIFYDNGYWWMFSSTPNNSILYLHYAQNLEGPWLSHPQNAIVANDPNIARPGGRVLQYNGSWYRIAQDDFPGYGESVRVFEITDLSTTNYSEVEIPESPILEALGTGWRSAGMHQVDHLETSPGQWLAVTDAYGFPDVVVTPPPPPPTGVLIPKTAWSLQYVDSQEVNGEDGAAVNAFDDNPNTFWHTEWAGAAPAHAHEIQINLGGFYDLNGLRYAPRQDGGTNGRVGNFEVYVSADGIAWGSPVYTGTFNNVASAQDISFPATPGQYIRFVALDDPAGGPFTAVSELDVYGNAFSGNLPPESFIDGPATNVTIFLGDSVNFAGSGSDSEGDYPLSYNWNFGSGSGVADSNAQNPGLVQFNNLGTFDVSMFVTDSTGNADATPATVRVTVVDGSVPTPLDKAAWILHAVDSEEVNGEDGHAANAFDDDPNTFWHTQWAGGQPTHPHDIQINLGSQYDINGLDYAPRQDGGTNGRIGNYEIYVSMDGNNWGAPVATGTFANNASTQTVTFAGVPGQYIRLRALSDPGGTVFTAVSEIGVYGDAFSGNLPPESTITSPASNVTIAAGDMVDFAGTGFDLEGDALTYAWTFGAGSGVADSNLEIPGATAFNTPGVYQVSLTTTDSQGNTDASPATVTVTVLDPSAPVEMAKTGWSLLYVDSQELNGEDGAAVNAFDGNLATIWHTAWSSGNPAPPHEIQIDLGQSVTLSSLRYWPRQDGGANGRIGNYEVYLSSDGANWGTAVATGSFVNSSASQNVNLGDNTGQYIRIRAMSEANGNPWTAVSEFDVFMVP